MDTIKQQLEKQIEFNTSVAFGKVQNSNIAAIACEPIVEDVAIKYNEWFRDLTHEYSKFTDKELYKLFKEDTGL